MIECFASMTYSDERFNSAKNFTVSHCYLGMAVNISMTQHMRSSTWFWLSVARFAAKCWLRFDVNVLFVQVTAGQPLRRPGEKSSAEGVEVALNPDELDMDSAAMQAKYEQTMKEQQSQLEKEDLSDMVAEHAAKQKVNTTWLSNSIYSHTELVYFSACLRGWVVSVAESVSIDAYSYIHGSHIRGLGGAHLIYHIQKLCPIWPLSKSVNSFSVF